VRVGSTRTLITGRLADQCFALSSESANQSQSAIVYGGIQYDMDSLAYLAANTPDMADSSRKDGTFRYMVEERPGGNRGGAGDVWTWGALPSTSREADYVSALLREAGFSTEVQKGLSASEERIKKMGTSGRSPRILHLATHGFAFPDPPKNPSKDLIDAEPTFKLLDDPMLRSGLVLAGVNHYWKNKRPLGNFEDGALVAYELCDLDLRNTELAVLSACLTGQGDVVGSEGVYGLQRAFRIAGAKFLIVSLWQVPDSQTLELMRLFYQNWLEKKESLRDAFDHAQQAFRKNNPSPFVWAGFVLVE
jgi:CHAT domain-containing protein